LVCACEVPILINPDAVKRLGVVVPSLCMVCGCRVVDPRDNGDSDTELSNEVARIYLSRIPRADSKS